MSEQGRERIESICETLQKATPTQREYMMGFAEGLAYASETRDSNENDTQVQED